MKKYAILISVCCSLQMLSAQGLSSLQQRKLNNALMAISGLYVDSINDKKLVETAIVSMLKELDPHSSYISKEEVERVNEPLEGSFEGVGIQFQLMEDTLLVVQTIAGCPAEKVGVMPGDRIIYINDELIAGVKLQNSDIMKRLRGKKDTEVTVKIKRDVDTTLHVFKIIRDKIPVFSVDANYMIGKDIGYIKVNNFGNNTVAEFQKAFTKLQKAGMKSLILSLQGNGGGYLTAAHQLADEFLSNGKLVVYTKGLNQSKAVMEATSLGRYETGKLIILVDEYAASASEILSGAIQDWDRGIIVGRRTFGKGLVQRQIPLVDGSMLRLTTARYYTPTGRCIQKSYKDGVEKYEKDLLERYKHGEFVHADSIQFPDSLRYQTLQLKRTVYGGGGIMPDIFVPLDTTKYTDYHRKIVGQGVVNKVSVQYIDKNRTELKLKYKTFDKFQKQFKVDAAVLEQVKKYAEKEKIAFDQKQFDISKDLIKLQLKALVARDLWEMNEYYQVIDSENESLIKAVEILQTKGKYEDILK
ncbi:MAG: peptidase S41 [Porphyromonadaceae bacterium CG2_30_38_12]|nr:MAG: peptidase S41 [Porphyromonadaceae bacterium CG2_30_38_12]